MFSRKVGRTSLTINTMLSLDPLTVGKKGYRELFQVGEAFEGKPLSIISTRTICSCSSPRCGASRLAHARASRWLEVRRQSPPSVPSHSCIAPRLWKIRCPLSGTTLSIRRTSRSASSRPRSITDHGRWKARYSTGASLTRSLGLRFRRDGFVRGAPMVAPRVGVGAPTVVRAAEVS